MPDPTLGAYTRHEKHPLDWREHPRYDTATARDFLDAAWEAAYVMDGPVEPGTEALVNRGGEIRTCTLHGLAAGGSQEYRLLDPPAPARPEWADLEDVLDAG
ncbi:hypothetical protein [Pseudactinotalea sp.]|uniref:hypothetical protein n=1 Tax=Pseudactinotalea sp. TaxID=1926260 RepID=UPI003B3ABA9A